MPLVLKAYRPDGQLDSAAIAEAARLLQAGRLVALPTETVYGLGANALDVAAVRGVFAAKGRPTFNPLIVHVLGASEAKRYVTEWPELAQRLADAFWPGPLSLVLPKATSVPDEVTGGFPAVALRAPAHPVARAVLEAAGIPIAAPSANRSNAISPTTAEHVVASLGDRIDAVLDGGRCAVGIESTVLDLTGTPRVLRPGGISVAQLEAIIGPVLRPGAAQDAGERASPGMLSRHYAPDAETRLVRREGLSEAIRTLPQAARIGVLVRTAVRIPDARIAAWEALGEDPARFAHDLYAALHRIEAAGATHVLVEQLPTEAGWEAVADRLRRAAGVGHLTDTD
jgi:L-threonylcarbamoyladenylate synthase